MLASQTLAQDGSWQMLAEMPTPRRLLAAAAEGGKIYTFGGCGSPCFQPPFHTSTFEETRVEVYDPVSNSWDVDKGPIPAILFAAAAAAADNGKIYLFGGQVTGFVTLEYHPALDSWAAKAPMPTSRHGLAVAVLNGEIYAVGGSVGDRPSNAIEVYDPKSDTWKRRAPMPTPRVFLAAVAAGGRLYAVGGSPDCCGDSATDVVEVYDPDTDSWSTAAPLPVAQQVSAAVGVGGKVITFGGFVPGAGARNATFEYDPATDSWTPRADMPTPRDQAPAVLIADGATAGAYVLGGSTDCHCQALPAHEKYTPAPILTDADLSIGKEDSPDPIDAGATLRYTLVVRNAGAAVANAVVVRDELPAGVTFRSAAAAGWSCSDAGRIVTCTRPALAAGSASSIRIEVTPTRPGVITNVAEVSSDVQDPRPGDNTATATTTVRTRADLGIETSDSADPIDTACAFSYTLEVRNEGPHSAQAVKVVDTLPPGVTFVSAGGADWTCVPTGGVVTCTRPSLAVGTAPPILIDVTAPVDPGEILNEATVSSDTNDPFGGNNTATETTTVVPTADLAITKIDSPDPVDVKCPLIYTLVVSNLGLNDATGLVVTDELPAAAVYLDAGGAGWTCGHASGIVTCTPSSPSPPTGAWPALLPVGPAPPITIRLWAPAIPGPIVNTARVTSDTKDPDLTNNWASETTEIVKEPADVVITKRLVSGAPTPGDTVIYEIEVVNHGPGRVCKAAVADVFPEELIEIDWVCTAEGEAGVEPSSGTGDLAVSVHLPADPPSGKVRCTVTALLDPNQEFFFDGVSPPPVTAPTFTNTATVTVCAGNDPDTSNNSSTVTTPIVRAETDLRVVKSLIVAGGDYRYTVRVFNRGSRAVLGALVSDPLPRAFAAAAWECVASVDASCTLSGVDGIFDRVRLGAGESVTYRQLAALVPSFLGEISNTVSVTTPPNVLDRFPPNNRATVVTVVSPAAPGARATKTVSGSFFEGGTVTYDIVLWNPDAVDLPDGMGSELVDDLPTGDLVLLGVTATSGTAAAAGNTAIWDGVVTARGSVTITLTARIEAGTAGRTICNQGTFSAGGIDTDDPFAPGTDDATCFTVSSGEIIAIPALSARPLALFALLLLGAGALLLRRWR